MTASRSWLVVFGAVSIALSAPAQNDWDHVHLVAPDTAQAAAWYADHFGGTVTKSGPFDAVLFGTNLVKFREGGDDTSESEGSVVDHIGFSVPDVAAKQQALEAAGAEITGEPRYVEAGDFTFGFVKDPWGTKIEVISDKALEGFHHVHVLAPDPDATIEWYREIYGGEVTRFKNLPPLPAIQYGDMWLLVSRARDEIKPSTGTSIDHIGWLLSDFDEVVDRLTAKDAKFLVEPRQSGDHRMAFVEGPDGVKIELVEAVK